MKYRNDFVTNSSSMISFWSDYVFDFNPPKQSKPTYAKTVTVYHGYPNDLKVENIDLASYMENGYLLPLIDFRNSIESMHIWERFAVSDVFMEYLNEVDCGARFEVKNCEKTGKLFLCGTFYDEGERHFEFDPSIPLYHFSNPSTPVDAKTAWESIEDKSGEKWSCDGHYFCSLNAYNRSVFLDQKRTPKNADAQSRGGLWNYHVFTEYLLEFLDDFIEFRYDNEPRFPYWLADKYLSALPYFDGGLEMRRERLEAEDGRQQNMDYEMHDAVSKLYEQRIIKKVGF